MRPVKLIMSAFGPFGATEEVDFREATDAGLFGIYGPTGAGKSSIFNAMTFALFGEGSKKEQPIVTMRSAHAAAEQLTEVSLIFELGSRRFLVRRQPDQMRPKVRTEGETLQAHAAWLFDVTDIEVDAITADNSGTVLAERKVGEVGKQVEALLGYGAEQFRQIVLLPQGRFERFLLADSRDRLAILRELFDVSLYRVLTQRMKDAAIVARRDIEDGRRAQGLTLLREGFASSEELLAGIENTSATSDALREAASAADTRRALAEEALISAEALDRRFGDAEAATRHLAELQARAEVIGELRVRRDGAELARRAADLDVAAEEAVLAVKSTRERAEAEEREAEAAIAFLAQCDSALETERAKAPELQNLQRMIDQFGRHQVALSSAADLKALHDESLLRLEQADQSAREAVIDEEQISSELQGLEQRLAKALEADFDRVRLGAIRDGLLVQLAKTQGYADLSQALSDTVARVSEAERLLETTIISATEGKQRLDLAERAFVDAQSQILATLLVEGEACPVCGGLEHPNPNHGGGGPRTAEANWRRAQASSASALAAEQDARAALSAEQRVRSEQEARRALLEMPGQPVEDLQRLVSEARQSIASLDEPIALRELEERRAALRTRHGNVVERRITSQQAVQRRWMEEAVARRSYEDQIASVPEQYRSGEVLTDALRIAELKVTHLAGALSGAETRRQQALERKTTAEVQLLNLRTRVVELEQMSDRARTAFASRLGELQLTAEQYRACRADVPNIASLHDEVRTFEADLAEAHGRAAEAQQAIMGSQRPELDRLRGERDAMRDAASQALTEAAAATATYQSLLRLRDTLAAELERLAQLERETASLRGLADAFDGNNEMRTALETYAIGAMFDQVLESANLRLDPMTAGRYHFERDTESVGGRSKRGLDVRIFDVQTGRAREISTLSGGETFIAALSLALGLSDVVEMNHGAIRLDTIFIDEGFGSLDQENDSGTLDLVLQVLQDVVGQSRAVGLISHVPLVQQAVPNGFSVIKRLGGSHIEKRAA